MVAGASPRGSLYKPPITLNALSLNELAEENPAANTHPNVQDNSAYNTKSKSSECQSERTASPCGSPRVDPEAEGFLGAKEV